jgi:hypothetical protein
VEHPVGFKAFIKRAFSDRGEPSSARMLSFWLSLSSMALVWWIVRHAMNIDKETAMIWVGGLPAIIYALAAFAISPFGIGKITGIWNRDGEVKPKKDKKKEE